MIVFIDKKIHTIAYKVQHKKDSNYYYQINDYSNIQIVT